MSHQTVAQQKAINEKNSKAKKTTIAKAKRRHVLEIKGKAKKDRPTTSFFDRRSKKPAAARDKLLNFGASSLDDDGQAVDGTLNPVNIDDEPKPAEVNDKVANNQATKDPVMPTTFSSHPPIKTFHPKDINPNLDESEDAKDIDDKDWQGLENDNDNRTTQDSNNQAQQASNQILFPFLSFIFLLFFSFSSLSLFSPT